MSAPAGPTPQPSAVQRGVAHVLEAVLLPHVVACARRRAEEWAADAPDAGGAALLRAYRGRASRAARGLSACCCWCDCGSCGGSGWGFTFFQSTVCPPVRLAHRFRPRAPFRGRRRRPGGDWAAAVLPTTSPVLRDLDALAGALQSTVLFH